MTDQCSRPVPESKLSDKALLCAVLALGCVACLSAISSQSYWLDEAGTAHKAGLTRLSGWWNAMRAEGNSNLQLPLYMFYAWVWEKTAGLGEFALRLGNAPWFLFGLLTMTMAVPDRRLKLSLACFILTSPFAWYYLDDARPYSVQFGCSLVVVGSLYRLGLPVELKSERRWSLVLVFGSLLLAGSGMLAMMWLGGFLFAAVLSTPRDRLLALLKRHLLLWSVFVLSLLIIGFYYLWTLTLGARAAAIAGTDVRNVLFIAYELLGFTGLGPGRLEIRTGGLGVFRPWIPLLALYAASLVGVGVCSIRQLKKIRFRVIGWWMLGIAVVFGLLIAVGVAVHFRLLGRHCTPPIAVLILVLGFGLTELLNSRSWAKKAIGASFLALALLSCIGLRTGERHAKDDYRTAAAIARSALAEGRTVWWNADDQGASVYGVKLSTAASPGSAIFISQSGADFKNLPAPDVVIASKPDVYDRDGALASFLKNAAYRPEKGPVAFTIWRRS